MCAARLNYIAPWWTYWLHNFPHTNLRLEPVDSAFRPQEEDYQQSLVFLGCVAAAALGLNLLFLATYLSCLCCCHKEDEVEEENKRSNSCCVSWTAVLAALVICSAVGVGFYGNSESNDGMYQMTYSLYNANHTLSGIDRLVTGMTGSMEGRLKEHLARLDEIFAARDDFVQTLRFMQQMANNIIIQLKSFPDLRKANVDLAAIADQTTTWEYYRWLTYLLLLIVDLVICLAACLALAKQSRWLLTTMMVFGVLALALSWASLGADTAAAVGTSDFCVAPDKFLVNQTKDIIATDVSHYYLYCSTNLLNPFQKSLTTFQRSLTTMQIQTQGLLQKAVLRFPTSERDLLGIQQILNSTESGLHQLTALLDCRSLHKDYLDALNGVCYDGVEGLLYLCLFSLLAAAAFCAMLCAIPHALKHIASRERAYDDIDEADPFNPRTRRTMVRSPSQSHVHSFCSYSSRSSQGSLHAAPPAISNAPVAEYMNQSMLFGGNPRYENVPLIRSGSGSPPPSYSPSMRANYLSVTDSQVRHFGSDYQI
ncbi:protein tweety homolog 2-like [Scleropages formosus]|uniref:Protein tweety homolog n=1 Tax=Scleropages formosus TaxID=113540 RepID=A0A8C9RU80_SCLFO|nr:protein tweety homolog 2-like [Scleropages formosus]